MSVAEEGPRATGGRAPDVFAEGGWVPMRTHAETEAVDFVIVGTGAGGGTLAARLAEKGFSVVAFDAGPFFRPLEDFASDEEAQSQLYWLGDDPRTSVVNPDGRTWDHRNLWVCDGSIFPTSGGVNPSLTIQAMALRTADRIEALSKRGEL